MAPIGVEAWSGRHRCRTGSPPSRLASRHEGQVRVNCVGRASI